MNLNHGQAVGVMIAIALVIFGLMWIGWRGRQRRSEPLVGLLPKAEPDDLTVAITEEFDGEYVSSTTHGDWLDRVSTAGLGDRSKAFVQVFERGILFTRSGASDVFIPAASIVGVETSPGMAGKFVGREGLVVITWTVAAKFGDGTDLDTGFRTAHKADQPVLLEAINKLITAQR